MTDAERKAYARGYNNRFGQWPKHIPPSPPVEQVRKIIEAGKVMRDWIDDQRALGAYEEQDVGVMLDQFDDATREVGAWILEQLRSPVQPQEPTR